MSASGVKASSRPNSSGGETGAPVGLDARVLARLDDIYKTGKLRHADLDTRALDALKEFPVDGALLVLTQFVESNLQHVTNKSAFLCGVMKNYRQRSRVGSGNLGSVSSNSSNGSASAFKGPDEQKIKEILDRTGYTLDVTTGQRKYGGPPPGWQGAAPSHGCEVFCGKIPRDVYESDLIPLFEKCGTIWDLRLMMDPLTNLNKGYAFVTYTTKEEALNAVDQLNDFEVRKSQNIAVLLSLNNHRLFVGNIPKNKNQQELFAEFAKHAPDLQEVIYYSPPDDKNRNRGFCFLEYKSHKAASLAKRILDAGRVKVWNCEIIVDWADPQEEPSDDVMSRVKVLYVKNLTAAITEEKLKEVFGAFGTLERVKKIKDYAFIHFDDRTNAIKAKEALDKKLVCNAELDVSLAKPPSDKKKKEDILRRREMRMFKTLSTSLSVAGFPQYIPPYGPLGVHGGYYGSHVPGQNGRGTYDHGMMWGWTGDCNWNNSQPRRGQWAGENSKGSRNSHGFNHQNGSNNSGGSDGTHFYHQGSNRGDRRYHDNLTR